MKPKIMVFGEQTTCDLIHDTLSTIYHIIHPKRNVLADTPIDLYIVDVFGLGQLHDWLNHDQAVETPVLLVLSLDELAVIGDNQQPTSDGLIVRPFETVELLSQVSLLLRSHEQLRELKLQAEQLAGMSKAIESSQDAIRISDTTGTAIYLNPAFTDLYGFDLSELNARGISNALFAYPDVADEIVRTVEQGEIWRGEVALKNRQGKIVPTFLHADSIEDRAGRRIGEVCVHTDITEHKRADALQKRQRIFEKALRDIAITLTSTLDINEVLDRILENVGRVVSYDMAYVVLKLNETSQVVRGTGIDDEEITDWVAQQQHLIDEETEREGLAAPHHPIVVSEVDDGWYKAHPPTISPIRSFVAAPIHLKDDLSGFLFLSSKTPGYFSDDHAERLQAFAHYAAIALQNARLYVESQQLTALQERQRLAHNLHDAVSQTLYSASVIAEALPLLWERNPAQVKPHLTQLHRLTRGAIAEMQTLLLELRPADLTDADFDDLLRQLADTLKGRASIEVHLDLRGDYALPDYIQTALFYIAQEALDNVVKHARATQVVVRLAKHSPAQLELSIIDNGRGFDPSQIQSTSVGLRDMRERAEAIGASLSITSQAGRGTELTVIWLNTHERKN